MDREKGKSTTRRITVNGEIDSWRTPHQDTWDKVRYAFRIISFIVGLPFFGIALAGFSAPFNLMQYPIMGITLSSAMLLYDIAELIVTCVQRRKTGIRPSVALGFELTLSLGGLVTSAFLVLATINIWQLHISAGNRNNWLSSIVPGYSRSRFWFQMAAADTVLAFFLSVLHFILFVRDCVEVDLKRKAINRFLKKAMKESFQQQEPLHDTTTTTPGVTEGTVELDNYDFNKFNDKFNDIDYNETREQKSLAHDMYLKR
ncbi:uncharacterized protein F4822DRAFT_163503 [Hypoxylon trugodes]|uniref:uncharacterized protein n=1 Tax=Hypoxylon trugodes TaxID=326681 RepID=UPI00218F4FFC|nr:uncharacterized protein F4822DRAFT_163503 [Hypoxylon trugodes]KAI1390797.1 hypothetical protein F4822DRAFT_163503 [Hypoxylon trugodes]